MTEDRRRLTHTSHFLLSGSHTDAERTLKAARQAVEDHNDSVARAEARHAVVLSAASRVGAEVEEHRSQAAAATASVDEVPASRQTHRQRPYM